ncbi:MAG: T9SS type A sorting domain-containing protein [Bacteroidetes bacterium]|nr:T9SS type A sorting domain-containing protein [Bacteroidota bacterium]
MRIIFTLLFSCFGFLAFGQDSVKPVDLVESQLRAGDLFEPAAPFSVAAQKSNMVTELDGSIVDYAVLDVNMKELGSLAKKAPSSLTLSLPALSGSDPLELDLVKVDLFSSDFEVTLASTDSPADVEHGTHYRGMINGDVHSVVAISVYKGEIMGLITSPAGNFVLGKLEGGAWDGEHILYDDKSVFHEEAFECGVLDDGISYKKKDLEWDENRAPGDCIRIYIEVDNDIYNNKGGAAGTTNYITGLMNQVITLYANENIPSVMSQLVLWDVTSPYSSTSSSGMLSDFQANTSSINGDLGQLFSYQASGGIAAGFSGICNPNVDNSLCFSSINSSYAVVPTYSWSVMVATHELGHLWGSRHTHACVWNGNNTAIDGCAGQTEGGCALPGYPSEGGTIMSYCHLQSVGINLSLGFGPQPGNVIRNSVDNATCTSSCGPPSCEDGIQNQDETGVDCGGSTCPACPTCSDGIQNGEELGVDCGGPDCAPCPCNGQDVTLTIVLDNYPSETTWTITSGGLTYASGGPYSGAGSTVVEVNCLNDGCYDFTIFDSFGDGICCAYGNGSYLLEDASGNTLASGGAFGSSETTNFCLSSTPSLSVSITDETNVSCNGGSDGSATAAATDGTAPYSYSWSNGGSGATISGLGAGSYTVTATDDDGNTATATATITEPSALSVSANGTDASCTGANDGSASASASGGTSPYSYSWSNGGNGSSISGLSAGTYSVTATDGNGCTATDAVTIGEETPGTSCDDGDACTVNDVLDANCNCAGTFQDSDGDGVCDADDACPGFDDNVDTDGDGIPDGCDDTNCLPVIDNFPTDPLQHSGSGASSVMLAYSSIHEDVSFTIAGLDAQQNGNPNNRYIEVATVSYDDGSGNSTVVGTYSGASGSTGSVSISGSVVSVTVSLADGYDGNAPGTLSINLGDVSSCDTGAGCPDDDGDGVCNAADVCPGFDDNIDTDGDGIPDGCDSSNCTEVLDDFPSNPLTHSGSGSSSTTLTYASAREDVSFTINGLDAVTNGNPNNRYIEEAVVSYDDGSGSTVVATFSGANSSSANVSIPGNVESVTVTLQDGYDGNAPGTLSINFSQVASCVSGSGIMPPSEPPSSKDFWAPVVSELYLFPNPVSLELNVQFELLAKAEIQLVITDVNGRILQLNKMQLDQGKQETQLDVSQLPEGLYLLHLQSKEQQSTSKFIIMR